MKWTLNAPAAGDMVRVKLGSIYHYGVFVSESEVIQFGLAPSARPTLKDSEIEVCSSDIDAFLCGGFLEVAEFDRAEKKKNRKPKQTVDYARSKLGMRGYNILYNNCEHFAYDCVTGKPYCSQTADLRSMFRALPLVDVYVARIPEGFDMTELYPKARQDEINGVSNANVRVEKWCVWKLLEYALERSLGLKMRNLEFAKTDAGKWTTEKCHFSLSHCDGVVAVAVSRREIGVDIEPDGRSMTERFAEKFLTDSERALYEQTDADAQSAFLLECWTKKESLFKRSGGSSFVPTAVDSTTPEVHTVSVKLGERNYVLSVATETPEALRLYTDIDLLSKIQ